MPPGAGCWHLDPQPDGWSQPTPGPACQPSSEALQVDNASQLGSSRQHQANARVPIKIPGRDLLEPQLQVPPSTLYDMFHCLAASGLFFKPSTQWLTCEKSLLLGSEMVPVTLKWQTILKLWALVTYATNKTIVKSGCFLKHVPFQPQTLA